MNIEMPAVRLLFSGRDDSGNYIFTVISYRPDINQSEFTLVVPSGCEVDCSDRRLRSMIVPRQV